jgi:hypothetical protein
MASFAPTSLEGGKVEQPTYRAGARISAEVALYDVPVIARVTARFDRDTAADGSKASSVEEGDSSIVLRGHGPGETTKIGEKPVTKTTVTLLGRVPEKIFAGQYKCVSLEVQDTQGNRQELDDELAMGFRIVTPIKDRLRRSPDWRWETKHANVLIGGITAFIRHMQAAAKQHMQVVALPAIASAGVLLLQLIYVGVIFGVYGLGKAAKFGDLFGFVTALFTGIGFVGLAATLFTQLQGLKYA